MATGRGTVLAARQTAQWLGGEVVYRRRACLSCDRQWATLEVLLDDMVALRVRMGST